MKVLFWMFIGFDKHETSEHLLVSVIEQLCKNGHEVHIFQKSSGGDLPSIPTQLSGLPVTTTTIPFVAASKSNFMARYLKELGYISKCKKQLKSSFDAIFIQSNTVAGFAVRVISRKFPNARITFNVQDIFPYNLMYCGRIKQNGLLFKLLAKEQRYAYTRADQIITISEDMKDTLVKDGVEEDKISVVYNWSYQDEPYTNLDTSLVSHMFNSVYFNVVYAGNIGVMQNVELIVDAAKSLKDDDSIRFHIIGDGVYRNRLVELAKEYNVNNISFWPLQKPEYAPLIYSAADVNIIPLKKDIYRTALPSKTATCLACNKPIIFAIGKNSLFGSKIVKETGCPVIGDDNVVSLTFAIKELKAGNIKCNLLPFYLNNCLRSYNSNLYSSLITNNKEIFN